MPGTVIALHQVNSQGAADKTPEEFLKITYPTTDVIKALKTVRADRDGGPVVLIGGRGKGKSHLMAVLHHAISAPEVAENWLGEWADRLQNPSLRNIKIATGFQAISETVNDNEFLTLWDLLFAKHKQGKYFKGKFDQSGNHIPARSLIEEMFTAQPTCLILDEFQSWYDALPEEQNGIKIRKAAFSFVQILSEISKDRPEILMFIVSVRNNETEAFRQLHRQTPTVINFSGETAQQDRQNLILYRLFENRLNIPEEDIRRIAEPYAKERYRLLFSSGGAANAQRVADEVYACWPFAPELISLLEDQILMAEAAQETRDMIRILATVFKSNGDRVPVITSSCFAVENESSEVQILIDSIASQAALEKLHEIALRNLKEIKDSGVVIPQCSEMIASIWMHSMAPDRLRGIRLVDLQLALSHSGAVDDNAFRVQLGQLVENSVNIHNDSNNQRYWFEQSKNPRTEVRLVAKNDNLWDPQADPRNGINHPGKDVEWLMKTLRQCFVGETTSSNAIVLGPHWNTDPWSEVDDKHQPKNWTETVLLVIPGAFSGSSQINATLGPWLKNFVTKRRNAVRFLIQEAGESLFEDKELMFLVRCSYLCSSESWGTAPEYRALRSDFNKPLESTLKERLCRFAVLRKWDYQNPTQCEFDVERLEKFGVEASANVEELIERNIFDLTDFNQRILVAAQEGHQIGEVIADQLLEPAPGEVLAFLGEKKTLEQIQELAANGKIALNVNGTWYKRQPAQSLNEARLCIRRDTTRTGSELARILLGTIEAASGGKVVVTPKPPVPTPTTTPTPVPAPVPAPAVTTLNPGTTVPSVTPQPAPPLPPVPQVESRHANPTNGVTLTGNFEKWGLPSNKMLKSATLNIEGISVAALKNFISRLPSAYRASLDVTFDPEDKQ